MQKKKKRTFNYKTERTKALPDKEYILLQYFVPWCELPSSGDATGDSVTAVQSGKEQWKKE